MTKAAQYVSLSAMDEERFGIKTAKTTDFNSDRIPLILEYCEENMVELLIARCDTSDFKVVHELERLGFLLMDTLIYFSCDLTRKEIPVDDREFQVRAFRPGEEQTVKSIAGRSFHGYLSHYHADSRLDKRMSDEVYADWAYKSCLSRKVTEQVLVAESGNEIIGFGTMRINDHREGEGLLFGVAPPYQGRGAYRSIMVNCMRWCVTRDLGKMTISTQITNLVSQHTWIRLGFVPFYSCYTFHKWFDR